MSDRKIHVIRLASHDEMGEHPTVRLLAGLTARLPSRFEASDLSYPSCADNPQASVQQLSREITGIDKPVVLVGHLQGAYVARQFLGTSIATGMFRAGKLLGAGLVSDPLRPRGQNLGPVQVHGYGIAGEGKGWPLGMAAYHVANPNDIITSAPDDSPLRDYKRIPLEISTDHSLSHWAHQVLADILDHRQGGTSTPEEIARDSAAFAAVQEHLYGYASDTAYCTPMPDSSLTYLDVLANAIEGTWV